MVQNDINSLIIIAFLLPLVIGIILGWQEKIVVFQDYNDLFMGFIAIILPIPLFFLYSLTESKIILAVCIFIEIFLFIEIICRTYQNNQGNLIFTFLSLYTKIPLSILFLFSLWNLLEHFSKPESKRNEGFSFLPLLILTPIILKLVKNKNRNNKMDTYTKCLNILELSENASLENIKN